MPAVRRLVCLFQHIGLNAVVVPLALAGVLTGCGAHAGRGARLSGLNFGAFAGYQWFGRTQSVGGTLTVPRVTPRPGLAVSGTWIGAEALGAGGARQPFIQVGVNEVNVGADIQLASLGRHDRAVYYAFWSDTAHHFHPIPLFQVRAGDRVATGLVLRNHRWRITVSDGATGRSFVTTQEGHAVFGLATWSQEDVTENMRTLRLAPYPDVGSPVLESLSVNGHAPAQASVVPTWMSVHGAVLKPTPLHHNSFTLIDTHPALVPRETAFLRALATNGYGALSLMAHLYGITSKTPHALAARWASQLSADYLRASRTLKSQQWFGDADSEVKAAIKADQNVVALTKEFSMMPARDYRHWRSLWNASVGAGQVAAAKLLRALRLPEIPLRPPST